MYVYMNNIIKNFLRLVINIEILFIFFCFIVCLSRFKIYIDMETIKLIIIFFVFLFYLYLLF